MRKLLTKYRTSDDVANPSIDEIPSFCKLARLKDDTKLVERSDLVTAASVAELDNVL